MCNSQQQPPPPATCAGVLYQVEPGDTMFSIAARFGVALSALIAANPQVTDPDLIVPGQILCVPIEPPACPEGFLYTVQPGDTLSSIALMFGISLQELIAANPQIPDPDLIAVGQPICIPIEEVPPDLVVYSTGPLSRDPDRQQYAGVLVENNTPSPINVTVRIFDKDLCPKDVFVEFQATVEPGCVLSEAISILFLFFYEVQVAVPIGDVRITIYGLSPTFIPIAANTVKHSQLLVTPSLFPEPPQG